jgi:hypothetical protein
VDKALTTQDALRLLLCHLLTQLCDQEWTDTELAEWGWAELQPKLEQMWHRNKNNLSIL